MLQSLGSQRVGHDWVTEQQYIHIHACVCMYMCIHVSTHTYKECMYMPTCMCVHAHACTHVIVYMCTCKRMPVCTQKHSSPICRAGLETRAQRTDLWTQRGKKLGQN